ncbi:Arm DNA-binding domain-containing protein [Gilliamella sp. App4-10]|uniref:Arm DNA-binding domain-containing protein n=1 Tax=Gilliamella sp. App4-10 TaxID=3120231 RepID=UPI003FA58444
MPNQNKKDIPINDDEGLSLCVAPCGGKCWHFRFSWQGKQPRISLAPIQNLLSLKEVRLKRDDYRADYCQRNRSPSRAPSCCSS